MSSSNAPNFFQGVARSIVGHNLEIIPLQSLKLPADADILSITYDKLKKEIILWVCQGDAKHSKYVCVYMVKNPDMIVPAGTKYIGTVGTGVNPLHVFYGE